MTNAVQVHGAGAASSICTRRRTACSALDYLMQAKTRMCTKSSCWDMLCTHPCTCGLADCVALTFEPWLLPPVWGRLIPLQEATASQQAFMEESLICTLCHLEVCHKYDDNS